ncbi:MAG TPA: hypothetical protein VJ695_08870 [Nitrososphaera sp.]|nr:hypothetical protein [Nitrososphaera sp.]
MKPSLWLFQLILVQYNDDASDERKVRMMIMVEPPLYLKTSLPSAKVDIFLDTQFRTTTKLIGEIQPSRMKEDSHSEEICSNQ